MALINYLAEVWGISIIVISFALLIKESYVKKLLASMESEGNLFISGAVSFVIGISMVLSQNIWVRNWQVIITILGWLVLVKGLAIMFFPGSIKNWIRKIDAAQFLPFALLALIIVGLVITYFGFTA